MVKINDIGTRVLRKQSKTQTIDAQIVLIGANE